MGANIVTTALAFLMGLVLRKYNGWTQNIARNTHISQSSTKIQQKWNTMKPATNVYLP